MKKLRIETADQRGFSPPVRALDFRPARAFSEGWRLPQDPPATAGLQAAHDA